MTWRNQCAPIIAKVLRDTAGKPEKEIKAALHDAYPFGLRQYHPYKIWCDEIRRQRGMESGIDRNRKRKGKAVMETQTMELPL